jgi:hypothetical protein
VNLLGRKCSNIRGLKVLCGDRSLKDVDLYLIVRHCAMVRNYVI